MKDLRNKNLCKLCNLTVLGADDEFLKCFILSVAPSNHCFKDICNIFGSKCYTSVSWSTVFRCYFDVE